VGGTDIVHGDQEANSVTNARTDLLQGTLELLILKTLHVGEPMHGWGMAVRIQQLSEEVLQLNQGSLYPALHRLEHKGWILSEWGTSENNRRAKFYRLTALGKRELAEERQQWDLFTSAVQRILAAT
jgi:transcriptional regulator